MKIIIFLLFSISAYSQVIEVNTTDTPVNGIEGRKIVSDNSAGVSLGLQNIEVAKVSAYVCIDQSGEISYTQYLDNESSPELPRAIKKKVLKAIYKYKFNSDPLAPKEQCGKITFKNS